MISSLEVGARQTPVVGGCKCIRPSGSKLSLGLQSRSRTDSQIITKGREVLQDLVPNPVPSNKATMPISKTDQELSFIHVPHKSVASKPCAARSLIPGGSNPVSLSSMMCLFQLALSKTSALIMLQLPHSLFLKYCREPSSVPQLSKPVEMTPGIMMTGCSALTPCDWRCKPTEKES